MGGERVRGMKSCRVKLKMPCHLEWRARLLCKEVHWPKNISLISRVTFLLAHGMLKGILCVTSPGLVISGHAYSCVCPQVLLVNSKTWLSHA